MSFSLLVFMVSVNGGILCNTTLFGRSLVFSVDNLNSSQKFRVHFLEVPFQLFGQCPVYINKLPPAALKNIIPIYLLSPESDIVES